MKKIRNVKGRRIIAFCLAALLLFVPFSSNLGGRFGASAEEPGDPSGDPPEELPVEKITLDRDFTFTIPDTYYSGTVVGEKKNELAFVPMDDKKVKLHVLSENVNVNVNPTLVLTSGTDEKGVNYYATNDGKAAYYYYTEKGKVFEAFFDAFDKYYEVYDVPNEKPSRKIPIVADVQYKVTYAYDYFYIPYDQEQEFFKEEPDTAVKSFVLDDTEMAVYIKPIVTSIEACAVSNVHEPYDTFWNAQTNKEEKRYYADNPAPKESDIWPRLALESDTLKAKLDDWNNRAVYRQIAYFTKQYDDPNGAGIPVYMWEQESTVMDEDGIPLYYEATTTGTELNFFVDDTANDIYVGKVKYDIEKTQELPTEKNYPNWGNAIMNYKYDANGYYYGAAAYFATVDGKESYIDTLATIDTIRIAKEEPKIQLTGLYVFATGTNEDGTPRTYWKLVDNSGGPRELFLSSIEEESKKYRYVVAAKGVAEITNVNGYTSSSSRDYEFTQWPSAVKIDNIEDTTDLWYYDIQYQDIKDSEFQLYVAATDQISNSNSKMEDDSRKLAPAVKLAPGEKLELSVLAEYKDGKEVDFTAGAIHTKVPIVLTIEAVSRCEIDSISVLAENEGSEIKIARALYHPETVTDKDDKDCELEQRSISDGDESETIWKATWKVTLPVELVNNIKLKNLKVDAKDIRFSQENVSHSATSCCDEFVYDATNPVVEFSNLNDPSVQPIDGETVWSKGFTLKGIIKSGKTGVEDYLAKAAYSIADEKVNLLQKENDPNLPSAFTEGVETAEFAIFVPESTSTSGTPIEFSAEDKAGNELPQTTVYVCVDRTPPRIQNISVEMEDDKLDKTKKRAKIKANISDNLYPDYVDLKIQYEDETPFTITLRSDKGPQVDGSVELSGYMLPEGEVLRDGIYSIEAVAHDKADNKSTTKKTSVNVDQTPPVFDITAESGLAPEQYFTNKAPVRVLLSFVDANMDYSNLKVTDNGKPVDVKWFARTASYVVLDDGKHVVRLSGKDSVGNYGDPVEIKFCVDTHAPIIQHTISGVKGANNAFTGRVNVGFNLGDEPNADPEQFHWVAKRTLPGGESYTYNIGNVLDYAFDEDGDYHIEFYAVDLAGNVSEKDMVDFSIDATKPIATISAPDGIVTRDTTVSFNLKKPMWKDKAGREVRGKATVYRKAGDGVAEQQIDQFEFSMTSADTSISKTYTETGVYRFELTMTDLMGNEASDSKEFTIDKEAPVITVTGANNYDKFDKSFELNVQVDEAFYTTKQVSVKGTRTDINGKVENLDFKDSIAPATNPTIVKHSFEEDGIYEITSYSKDAAGNESTNTIHFTIDKTNPEIGDLSAYDNKVFNTFDWNVDLQELVSDLTVCDISMLLNGTTYDGKSDLEDGAYTLVIKAVDELGHSSEKTINFVLDTKAPVFVVTGVEDGEIKNEAYKINISLQLSEDILDSVLLNGETVMIGENNTVSIDVDKQGKYELTLHARDAAGNESEEVISFVFGKEKKFNSIFLIAAIAGGILVIGGIIFIILAKRRKEDDRY